MRAGLPVAAGSNLRMGRRRNFAFGFRFNSRDRDSLLRAAAIVFIVPVRRRQRRREGERAEPMATDVKGTEEKSPSNESSWKERIMIPTLLAGVVGGGAGLLSKQRMVHGAAKVAASYATNLAIVAGTYCGARELARDARASEPHDLINSVVGGVTSGAILGRLQGGQLGAAKYAIIFAVVGTSVDFATLQLRPYWQKIIENSQSWSIPEWSPIQVLDEEALAEKRAREQQFHARRTVGKLNKEES